LKLLVVTLVVFTIQANSSSPVSAQGVNDLVGSEKNPPQSTSRVPAAGQDKTPTGPQCETSGTREITIVCTYTPTHQPVIDPEDAIRIVLNRAQLSFETKRESHMFVELEFTNEGREQIAHAPTVYLAIDDDAGRNVVRRVLSHVDLSKIQPSERLTFSERLLVGAFSAGRYAIFLSIPNPNSSLKDNPSSNILFSNVGVADPTTGLNRIANFTVGRSIHSSRE
jgi:hypothetical protein